MSWAGGNSNPYSPSNVGIKGALVFAVLVKKESMKQGIHLSNIHITVVSSTWELGRKAILEEGNSYKLSCVSPLQWSCKETS